MPGRYDNGVSSTKLVIPEILWRGEAAVALARRGRSGNFIKNFAGDLGGDMSNSNSGSLSGVVPLRENWLLAWGIDKGGVFSGRNEVVTE